METEAELMDKVLLAQRNMHILTVKHLMASGQNPCKRQLEIFQATWPKGMELNIENYKKAISLYLDMRWIIDNSLPSRLRDRYNAETALATEQFDAEDAQAWKHYLATTIRNQRSYYIEATEENPIDCYRKKITQAHKRFYEVVAPFWLKAVTDWIENYG